MLCDTLFIYILNCLLNCLLIWKIQLFVIGQHPRCSPWISKIIFFSWLAVLLTANTFTETVLFGLGDPWPPQLIQRIIPWQIILKEGFPKEPAFWKVTSLLCNSESSHVSALAGGGIPEGKDEGGRTGWHVVGMSVHGMACHTPAWGSAVPQVNILMSNFHSVVFSQHMGFKKQLKENCTHLLISEACDFRRVCQINFHI